MTGGKTARSHYNWQDPMSDPASPIPRNLEFQRPVEVFVIRPVKDRYWLHVLLLLATLFSMLVVGARMEYNFQNHLPTFYQGEDSLFFFPIFWAVKSSHLLMGIPFAFSLIVILFAHEMGHYLYCRYYGVSATLPFFIPFPTLFGTMGAFIRIRSPIRSRNALFDIGVAGPIAGFVVAIVVLVISLGLSQAAPPGAANLAEIKFGYPLIFHLVHGMLASVVPAHSIAKLPLQQVYLHPMAVAAWVGMFATALNLLPGGQLDGGHIVFSISPRAHRWVSRLTILALIPLAIYCWTGWLIWSVLLGLSGMRHPQVSEMPGIDRTRRYVAVFALLLLVLTWTPTPVAEGSLLETVRALMHR